MEINPTPRPKLAKKIVIASVLVIAVVLIGLYFVNKTMEKELGEAKDEACNYCLKAMADAIVKEADSKGYVAINTGERVITLDVRQ